MVGRIPVLDVTPQIEGGRYPAKAAVGEPFEVTALVLREGHDAHSAEVVLVDPTGRRRAPQLMQKVPSEADRWRATVSADVEGAWGFEIHGWSDPYGTWVHDAEIKDVRNLPKGGARVTFAVRLEVEGAAKPALLAAVNYAYFP